MLSNSEYNTLYILEKEKEFHKLRSDKDDIEYKIVIRWLDNRIKEIQSKNKRILK